MKRLTCEQSGKDFTVRDADLVFLEKLSPTFNGRKYLIPPPTLSPQVREIRRLAFRNERVLYRRKSSLSGKEMISCYHPDAPFVVYTKDEWWGDKWDATEYGRQFDFSRPFFEQFFELQSEAPRPPLVNNQAENSEFCNFADRNRNCYMVTSANDNEDCYYGWCVVKNRNVTDGLWITNSELLYQCVDCRNCYNVQYSQDCENCSDAAFLLDCRQVNHSIFCVGLRNKKFHILNEQASEAEFKAYIANLSGGLSNYKEALDKFEELKRKQPIRRANFIVSSENIVGAYVFHSKDIHFGFDVYESRDCAYVYYGLKGVDCHDICFFDGAELCYESTSLIGYGYGFTTSCRDSDNLFYCDNCHHCRNCFGCVGLRNKEYCVFNTSLSREGYEELCEKIIVHTEKTGEWGEFFPIKFSPFAYNETVAYEYYPLTREKVFGRGWRWQEDVQTEQLSQRYEVPDHINDVSDQITKEVLACLSCGKNFRIVEPELRFYRKTVLPLPQNCPQCRHNYRIHLRHRHDLWKRGCAQCRRQIWSSYAPERAEKVLCEECYAALVF